MLLSPPVRCVVLCEAPLCCIRLTASGTGKGSTGHCVWINWTSKVYVQLCEKDKKAALTLWTWRHREVRILHITSYSARRTCA